MENYVYFVFPSTLLQVRESANRRVRPSRGLDEILKAPYHSAVNPAVCFNYVYDLKLISMIGFDLTDIRGLVADVMEIH